MTTLERFEKHINKTDTCWLWTGSKNNKGYGKFGKGKASGWDLAHRRAYEIYNDEKLSGGVVMHSCDIPSCVNPDHLSVGTQKDNMQDCLKKDRFGKTGLSGENHPRSKLTQDNVNEIRLLLSEGISGAEIGRRFNVTRFCIYDIKSGKSW